MGDEYQIRDDLSPECRELFDMLNRRTRRALDGHYRLMYSGSPLDKREWLLDALLYLAAEQREDAEDEMCRVLKLQALYLKSKRSDGERFDLREPRSWLALILLLLLLLVFGTYGYY